MIPVKNVSFRMIELSLVYNDVVNPDVLESNTPLVKLNVKGQLLGKVLGFLSDDIFDNFGSRLDVETLWINSETIQDLVVALDHLVIDLLVDSIYDH